MKKIKKEENTTRQKEDVVHVYNGILLSYKKE